ncbi:retrovirus-related pol polyprotein from transposon TNT 1-94 [Tanacetum coccineum]
MAALESCPKHNMVAYLEKTEGNTKFHEIIDFLTRSSIHYTLIVSPVVSTTFVEQFWTSAKSQTINNVRYINAKVAGKPVTISEASIRSDLMFDDADGIDVLNNQAIFDNIQLMGYEGDLTILTFNKALFSPQWKFFFHTMNHCISSKSTSWDQIPTNIATAVICLAINQKYNFSKLIFDGMIRHLDAKKKFVMYPRFISIFLGKQLKNVSVPLDHFPVNALTSKVFSFMVKKGKHFSRKVTPLFPTMLAQPTEDEDQTETQVDPSPRSSPSIPIPDPIPEGSGRNHGGQSSSDRSLSGNEGDLTLQSVYDLFLFLCIQGRKSAKAEPSVHKDQAFDDLDDFDGIEYMETDAYQEEGVSTDQPKVSIDKLDEGTDKPNEGTDSTILSTDKVEEDGETIAQVLLNMSQAKAVSKEKEKGVELKDVEEIERPRPTVGKYIVKDLILDKPCLACEKGKYTRASFKTKQNFSIKKCLHLLQIDLFGPVIKQIRTANGTEFRNSELEIFCDEKGISHNFSSLYTPKQNGVAERKNRTLIKAARTMLNRSVLSKHFWTEAARIACYTQNRSIIIKRHDKTPYEIFRERITNISYFHVIGCPMFIHNHKDHLGKFDTIADDGYFLGQSYNSKAFRFFNTRRQQIEETSRVTFDESIESIRNKSAKDDSKEREDNVVNVVKVNQLLMDDKGFVDSGCLRHMTGNIAYLSNFKEFNGGYVTFRGGAHGGRIFEVGTLRYLSLVVPLKKVGDEAVHKELGDIMERAATTASSLEAE